MWRTLAGVPGPTAIDHDLVSHAPERAVGDRAWLHRSRRLNEPSFRPVRAGHAQLVGKQRCERLLAPRTCGTCAPERIGAAGRTPRRRMVGRRATHPAGDPSGGRFGRRAQTENPRRLALGSRARTASAATLVSSVRGHSSIEPLRCTRHVPKWRNWQTRGSQTPLAARSSGFKSRLRHQQGLVRRGPVSPGCGADTGGGEPGSGPASRPRARY